MSSPYLKSIEIGEKVWTIFDSGRESERQFCVCAHRQMGGYGDTHRVIIGC